MAKTQQPYEVLVGGTQVDIEAKIKAAVDKGYELVGAVTGDKEGSSHTFYATVRNPAYVTPTKE